MSLASRASSLCGRLAAAAATRTAAAACSNAAAAPSQSPAAVEYTPVVVPDEVKSRFPDAADRRRLDAIAAEYETVRYVSIYCPDELPTGSWADLFHMENALDRLRHYGFLNERQKEKRKDMMKKMQRARRRELQDAEDEFKPDIQPYNRILQRIEKPAMSRANGARVASDIMAGVAPRVLVDMQFVDEMSVSQRNLLWNQLRVMIAHNKAHRCPADLHFANFDADRPNEHTRRFFSSFFKHSAYSLEPTFHKEDLLQLYGRSDLLYLSPDAPNMLRHVDVDRVYVIGGMLKQPAAKVTLAKAKRLGIECAKLPLDRYINWRRGHKSLTLNATLCILLDYVASLGDWRHALERNISVRYVRAADNPVATLRAKQRRAYYREMLAIMPPVPVRGESSGAHEPRITGWKRGRPLYRTDGQYGIDM